MDDPPPPLSYATPVAAARKFAAWPAIVLLVLWAEATVLLAFVALRMMAVFQDFGVNLPTATKLLLALARWWANDYGWLFAMALAAGVGVGLGFAAAPFSRPADRRGVYWLFFLGTLALVAAAIVGLFLPMVSLIQAINNS